MQHPHDTMLTSPLLPPPPRPPPRAMRPQRAGRGAATCATARPRAPPAPPRRRCPRRRGQTSSSPPPWRHNASSAGLGGHGALGGGPGGAERRGVGTRAQRRLRPGTRAKAGTRRGRGELQADCKQEERLLHFTSPLIPAPLPPSHTFPTRLATEDVYDVARGRGRKCGGTQQPRGAQRKCAFVFLFFLLFVAVLTCRAGAAVSPRRPSSAPPTRRPSRGPLRVARAAASARAPPPPCRRHRWKPLRPPTASTVASCRRRPLVRATRSCCVLCRWAIWSVAAPRGILRRGALRHKRSCQQSIFGGKGRSPARCVRRGRAASDRVRTACALAAW